MYQCCLNCGWGYGCTVTMCLSHCTLESKGELRDAAGRGKVPVL